MVKCFELRSVGYAVIFAAVVLLLLYKWVALKKTSLWTERERPLGYTYDMI